MNFNELKSYLKKNKTDNPSIRAAIIGDSPTQLISTALRAAAIKYGYQLDLYEAEYNQVNFEILNPNRNIILQKQHLPSFFFPPKNSSKSMIRQAYNWPKILQIVI